MLPIRVVRKSTNAHNNRIGEVNLLLVARDKKGRERQEDGIGDTTVGRGLLIQQKTTISLLA